MITENDVQVGVTLKYLGGSKCLNADFTVGKLYTIWLDNYNLPSVQDDSGSDNGCGLFDFELWERYYTVSKPSNEIFLVLSQDEAQMLADLLACVGGCPELSRRKFTKSVSDKLKVCGIEFTTYYNNCRDLSGTINCKTIFEPEPVKETVEYNGSTYDKIEFDNMLGRLEKL